MTRKLRSPEIDHLNVHLLGSHDPVDTSNSPHLQVALCKTELDQFTGVSPENRVTPSRMVYLHLPVVFRRNQPSAYPASPKTQYMVFYLLKYSTKSGL